VLDVLAEAGYQTELAFPHWIGKAYCGEDFLDVIFSSGNGICRVDAEWFEHAIDGNVLGMPLKLCPAEETIWQKSFILERDRCDVADVAHFLRACAKRLDWQRLLRRFGDRWEILYVQLILFGFIYPDHRADIPTQVMQQLAGRFKDQQPGPAAAGRVCQGTMLSATQYLRDIGAEGYHDARLIPWGNMTPEQIAVWTANFE